MSDETVGELNAEEIFEFDNLAASKKAADSALNVAMNFHMNRRSLLERDVIDLWKRLADRLGIPQPSNDVGYVLERRRGVCVVVEVDPKAQPWLALVTDSSVASTEEVVTYLRQRAAMLTELGESWEDIEHHKAERYFEQAGTFEEAADYLEARHT